MVVQRTDAATRCGLQGSYWLEVGRESLLLREKQKKNIVREWPYELLRRYGKDKVRFPISQTIPASSLTAHMVSIKSELYTFHKGRNIKWVLNWIAFHSEY